MRFKLWNTSCVFVPTLVLNNEQKKNKSSSSIQKQWFSFKVSVTWRWTVVIWWNLKFDWFNKWLNGFIFTKTTEQTSDSSHEEPNRPIWNIQTTENTSACRRRWRLNPILRVFLCVCVFLFFPVRGGFRSAKRVFYVSRAFTFSANKEKCCCQKRQRDSLFSSRAKKLNLWRDFRATRHSLNIHDYRRTRAFTVTIC